VEDYQRQFLSLLCRFDGLTPKHQMNLFTAGLGEPMRFDIEMQRPADQQNTMSLAYTFERHASVAVTVPPCLCMFSPVSAPTGEGQQPGVTIYDG
jgi:hypothetical protein